MRLTNAVPVQSRQLAHSTWPHCKPDAARQGAALCQACHTARVKLSHLRDTEATLPQMVLNAPVLDTACRIVALKLCKNDVAGRPWQPLQANKGGAAHTVLNGGIVHLQEGKASPHFAGRLFADVSTQILPLNHAGLAQSLC